MRKPAIIAITGVLTFIASIVIIGFMFLIGIFPKPNATWELFPMWIMMIGGGLAFGGWCYNYWEYKKHRIPTYWMKGWDFGV